jgi:hypothetical protein
MTQFVPFFLALIVGAAVVSLLGVALILKIDGQPIWPHVRDKAHSVMRMAQDFWRAPLMEKSRIARHIVFACLFAGVIVIALGIYVPGLALAQPWLLPVAFVVTAALAKGTVIGV